MNFIKEMELYDALDEIVLKLDSSYRIIYANRKANEIGYDIDVLKGKVIDVIISPQHRRVLRASLETSLKLWNTTRSKISILNSYGELIPVEVKVVPLENKGILEYYVLIKPEYDWNLTIFKDFVYPVIVLDSRNKVMFLNAKALKILEKKSIESILSEESVDINGKTYKVHTFELYYKLRKAKMIILSEISGVDPLFEKFAIAGIMSSLVSHDLKNLLTSLVILVGGVKEEELRNKLLKVVERIKKIHQRVLNIVKPRINLAEFDLHELVDEVRDNLEHKFKSRDVHLTINMPKPFILKTDRDVLYEIIHNLISNAIDASDPKGQIIVSAGVSQYDDRIYNYISIKDFGKGIDSKDLTRIFDPFFTTKEGGTGLGLFIVKKFVKILDGKIAVKSEKGKGTEFIVYIPDSALQ